MSELGQFALFLAWGAAFVALLVGPIGKAIAKRIAGGRHPVGVSTGEMDAARVNELEQRLGELETAQARIAELEERLDFAERMLASPAGEPEKALPSRSVHG
jgi:hypothetical protein